jgi:hypothetical protein
MRLAFHNIPNVCKSIQLGFRLLMKFVTLFFLNQIRFFSFGFLLKLRSWIFKSRPSFVVTSVSKNSSWRIHCFWFQCLNKYLIPFVVWNDVISFGESLSLFRLLKCSVQIIAEFGFKSAILWLSTSIMVSFFNWLHEIVLLINQWQARIPLEWYTLWNDNFFTIWLPLYGMSFEWFCTVIKQAISRVTSLFL